MKVNRYFLLLSTVSTLMFVGFLAERFDRGESVAFAGEPMDFSPEAGNRNPFYLRVYPVPPVFQSGYVGLLSALLSEFHPEPALDDTVEEATPSVLDETDNEEPDRVFFDAEKRIVSVLGDEADHRKVEDFFGQLADVKNESVNVSYRLVLVRRAIDPRLKNYPNEFIVKGKCWGNGRYRNSRYPKWLNDREKKYPHVFFQEIDIDREEKETLFFIQGFVKDKKDARSFFKGLAENPDTESNHDWMIHDFLRESQQSLKNSFVKFFPEERMRPLIRSLQKIGVYKVNVVSTLIGESCIPGSYRTVLNDDFSAEIRTTEGLRKDRQFQTELFFYKKSERNQNPFSRENLQLASTLLTRFDQTNILGVRDGRDRRLLLIVMAEEGKL